MNHITLLRDYIYLVHRPAAEDGHPPAVRLVALADSAKGRYVDVPLDEETVEELRSAAGCHLYAEGAEYLRVARRILQSVRP